MKLKLLSIAFIFIGIINIGNAQGSESTPQNYHYFPTEYDRFCGGRDIIVTTNELKTDLTQSKNSDASNLIFLEISLKGSNNFAQIPFKQKIHSSLNTYLFQLPDTLKAGQTYQYKLGSKNPNWLQKENTSFLFGVGLMPFSVNFDQNIVYYKENEIVSLTAQIKLSDEFKKTSSYTKFFINLSNGTQLEPEVWTGNQFIRLTSIANSEKSNLKISEISNVCGTKGTITGEAKFIKKEFIDKIELVKINDFDLLNDQCFSKKIIYKVVSKSIKKETKLKLQLSSDYNYKTIDFEKEVILNAANQLIEDIPSMYDGKYFYLRLVAEELELKSYPVSQYGFINYFPDFTKLNSSIVLRDNKLKIIFYQNNGKSYTQLPFNELIINGKDVSKAAKNGVIEMPIPKNDTSFVISKASNYCNGGLLAIQNPILNFVASKNSYVTFNQKNSTACPGETVEYSFQMSNEKLITDIKLSLGVNVFFNRFSTIDGKFLDNYGSRTIYFNDYTIDPINKILKIKIPNNLEELIKKGIAEIKEKLEIRGLKLNFYLYSSWSNSNDLIIEGNNYSQQTTINLPPNLSLTKSRIDINGAGLVEIPIKFLGTKDINYTLSNGVKGFIDHKDVNTSYNLFKELTSGEQTIKLLIDKTTTIRILNAENECGLAQLSGETQIVVKDTVVNKIEIDELSTSNKACYGTTLEIPYISYGSYTSNKSLLGKVKLYERNGNFKSESFEINKSPFNYQIPADRKYNKLEVWIEDPKNNIKTSSKTFILNGIPIDFNFYSEYNIKTIKDGEENYPILKLDSYYKNLFVKGANVTFNINGKSIPQNDQYWSENDYQISRLVTYDAINKDSTLILKSISNECGVLELNKTMNFVVSKTLIHSINSYSQINLLPTSNCAGTNRYISYLYLGEKPEKGSIKVQLARNGAPFENSVIEESNLKFFNVPTFDSQENELGVTIPDTCSGNYFYRLVDLNGNQLTSNINYGFYDIQQKINAKLTTANGKNEVIGIPSANVFLTTNQKRATSFYVELNDGTVFSSSNFGIYNTYSYDPTTKKEVYKLVNYGKTFSPKVTTNYSLKSVYNNCGLGVAEGSVKIIVSPSIKIDLNQYSSTFCEKDSSGLKLEYFGAFPQDTLMGVYLHGGIDKKMNIELATFKNNPSQVLFKLPAVENSMGYYLQVRKKSRASIIPIQFTTNNPDSTVLAQNKLNFDSDLKSLTITNAPNITLSGTTEIFAGQSARLNILGKNSTENETDPLNSPIYYPYGMTTFVELSDGSKYQSTDKIILVSPLKTTTYSIKSISNYCGIGNGNGSPIVTVYSKSDKRIETLGLVYSDSVEHGNGIYYRNYDSFCSNKKDSLDIKVFGTSETDFSKYKVILSDKNGINYKPINTYKASMVQDSINYKLVRLWFQIPEDATYGTGYLLKGISTNETILSTPVSNGFTIFELPTATLTGKASINKGEKVSTIVKLTGMADWLLNITDKDNQEVFNNFPTKKDSSEYFKNVNFIKEHDFKIDLTPLKSNTYQIKSIANRTCGIGKVANGSFVVELLEPVLANEKNLFDLVKIYPNPTIEAVKIDLRELNEEIRIQLFGINGNLLEQKSISKLELKKLQEFNFGQKPNGIYLLNLSSKSFEKTYKIIKN